MKNQLRLLTVFLLIITAFTACNKASKSTFTLTGTLEGITEGKIILSASRNKEIKPDTASIENGKFIFTGNITEPAEYVLEIVGKEMKGYLYAENAKITYTAHADSLWKSAKITGGKVNDDENALEEKRKALVKKYDISKIRVEWRSSTTSKDRKAEIDKLFDKYNKERQQLVPDFIKENPASYYSAILIEAYARGKSAEEIGKEVDMLDPKLARFSRVAKLREKVENMKKAEIGVENIMSNASNVSYKLDETFKGKQHQDVVYLGVFTNDNICTLKKDGTVQILNSNGKKLSSFKAEFNGQASSIAVDNSNNIYVFATLQKKENKKIRGKVYEITTPLGVECLVFNTLGVKENELKLSGVLTATGARVVGNKLIVADYRNRKIVLFDANTGETKSNIPDLRTCCRILDFSVNSNNEILVANLGAFRVQSFDVTGKNLIAFGQRGNTIDDFHGCCNPVSVAYLSNGAIVTVEKSPTRIKIFSKEGAKEIAGIEELVEGCSYIPMIVDSKDNLYLASARKGLIKCVSSK